MNPIPVPVRIKRLTETAIIPTYGTPGSAGMDFHADIQEPVIIAPGETVTFPTGIAMAIPAHLALFICPRSGLSAKSKITVHNGPGVIDADYRKGIGIILHNTHYQQFVVNPGDRIAQGVILPVFQAIFDEVEDLGTTDRDGGFGSTGVSAITVIEGGKIRPWTEEEKASAPRFHSGGFVTGAPIVRTLEHHEVPVRLSPIAELGFRAMRQDAFDRARAEQASLPVTLTKWLDAEPEEAAAGLVKERAH
ncbi:dUTP diphosphatase [Methylorubrum extorquens]|uniref:dUTP diphosphatase n=1 Tax=Methylorubrum extorquens TaxID=408 RepID=UPI0020A16563|nr:deoxyuridine 5'-triphosphate nucleotidohydrolase [Methylorubrum extorquens]